MYHYKSRIGSSLVLVEVLDFVFDLEDDDVLLRETEKLDELDELDVGEDDEENSRSDAVIASDVSGTPVDDAPCVALAA